MRNIFIGSHVINIGGLTEAELEKLGKELEASLDEVDEALNKGTEEEAEEDNDRESRSNNECMPNSR